MNVVILLLILSANLGQGAKILGIFPVASPSHYILGSALMRELAERGHDVTVISAFGEKNPPKNGSYQDIILTGFYEVYREILDSMNVYKLDDGQLSLSRIPYMINRMLNLPDRCFNHPNIRKFLKSNKEFDLVIVEQSLNEAIKILASHFKAPLIVFNPNGAEARSMVNVLVGNPEPVAYIPDALLGFSSDMTFLQRLTNSLMFVVLYCSKHLYIYPKQNRIIKKHFPNLPDIDHVLYNVSIVLVNAHPSITQPVPYVPNMIDIGGFHIKPPKKLPQDLQEFLDNAREGVIYFSLGSNVRSSQLPEEKRKAFVKTFAQLKQKVLWKWEDDVLPGQPPNVKLGKWLPQQDILAHPNIKLFITQGGLYSIYETIDHGVPVLAIPFFGDQKLNSQRIVKEGFGLSLRFKEITEEKLANTLRELLTNPSYANNARKKSAIFHDRITSPMETAVYWLEYVIRHRGAPHLKVAGVELPWYQYFLLDVVLCLSLVNLFGFYIFYLVFKKIVRFCKSNRKLKQK